MSAAPRENLSDKIRRTLEAEITTGQLSVGSRIDEQALMERFEVSRTPAREALLQLMSAGLVVSVPRQGAVVAGLSAPEYVSMLEVLVELEGLAARLAARRMPSVRRQKLKAAHAACVQAAERDDVDAYVRANREFHEAIYDGSLNEVLAKQLRAMRVRMRQPQANLFDRPGRMRHSAAEHQGVVDAILQGDEEGAYHAMTRHIAVGGNSFADAIARLPFSPVLAPALGSPELAADAQALTERVKRTAPAKAPVRKSKVASKSGKA
jgi:DNA-binding GntR family transcriptional regulator